MMEQIEIMKQEYKELESKFLKAKSFLVHEIDKPQFTDEKQRLSLGEQLVFMAIQLNALQDKIACCEQTIEK